MRAVWKGTIGYGDFAVPVRAYGAVSEQGTGLNLVHTADGGRIRHRRVCEIDGAEVPAAEVGKGAVLPGGSVVVLTDDDVDRLPLPTASGIEICGFAPMEQIDPIYFARSYHLEPEVSGTRAYVLLSEALQQTGKVAVVKVALRQRETLGVLRVRDQVIVLATMHWPEEVRTPDFPFLHEDVDVRLPDVRRAAEMIDRLAGDFEPGRYTDRYQEALTALVEAKAEGGEVAHPAGPAQQEAVTELLSALGDSGAAVRRARAAAREAAEAKAAATRAARRTRDAADARR
ncbi:DNA end-binding protein Ku [Amycolatopsis arida]|uniref:Non-homologous end joining protein Ku n=1 Tax=Amycolatopsis arida TaxID=587909 RepID=A0A1I5KH96_9PSEU|nr:Ku protein [Amycolatopsis arida]TDX97045.1 DNA end-binding protein Ku [Amycolatopsis arida]SFO84380.1 DNA end-binding protein Ku [Amycolatopsis arida]